MSKKISEQEKKSRENYKKQVDETFSLPSQVSSGEIIMKKNHTVRLAGKDYTVIAENYMEAISLVAPDFEWRDSDYPTGTYTAGTFDGTIDMPFLAQVKKPNGVWSWVVNISHPQAKFWEKKK